MGSIMVQVVFSEGDPRSFSTADMEYPVTGEMAHEEILAGVGRHLDIPDIQSRSLAVQVTGAGDIMIHPVPVYG